MWSSESQLQELVVTGLENVKSDKSKELARDFVAKWLKNVYASYIQSGKKMFEKYDVEQVLTYFFYLKFWNNFD